jgi:phosphoenolpyruvate synthase/pyruvate phosphate dikinase
MGLITWLLREQVRLALLDSSTLCNPNLLFHSQSHDKPHAVSVQLMVRSDLASSGVAFTLDPDTGFRNAIVITGSYGLGESVVGGKVDRKL